MQPGGKKQESHGCQHTVAGWMVGATEEHARHSKSETSVNEHLRQSRSIGYHWVGPGKDPSVEAVNRAPITSATPAHVTQKVAAASAWVSEWWGDKIEMMHIQSPFQDYTALKCTDDDDDDDDDDDACVSRARRNCVMKTQT